MAAAHGIAGKVLVEVISDRPDERFAVGRTVRIGEREMSVTASSGSPKGYLVGLSEITTRSEAEKLRGKDIFADRAELQPKSDEFYHDQLMGFAVVTESGKSLGTLREIITTGANDVYEVGTEEQTYLIPAIKDVVVRIDEGTQTITIHEMEGLLE